MKIALDCNALIELGHPGDPVAEHRLAYLLKDEGAELIVPTPALSEFLVGVEAAALAWLHLQIRRVHFRIGSFDQRAAHECAAMERQARAAGYKPQKGNDPRQHVKLDRQILAVARVHGCDRLLTNDKNLINFATRLGVACIRPADLPLPPPVDQGVLDFEAAPTEEDALAIAPLTTVSPPSTPPDQSEGPHP